MICRSQSALEFEEHFWTTAIEESLGTKNWVKIPSITYQELKLQMGYEPTTLILDCEGATTDILKSYPELMNSVDTVIIENDFGNGRLLSPPTQGTEKKIKLIPPKIENG